MPAQIIQFANKDKTGDAPLNLWRDIDANEVKTVVNAHATDLDGYLALFQQIIATNTQQSTDITAKNHTSFVKTETFDPTLENHFLPTYVCGAENIEVQLSAIVVASYAFRCRVLALGFPVNIVPQGASVAILTGPTTIPVGGVVEITRVNIGNDNLTRYVVLPLYTP